MANQTTQVLDDLPEAVLVEDRTAPAPVRRPVAKPAERSRKLGEWLILEGLITGDQLGDALAYQAEHGGKLGEILVRLGMVDAEEYVAFLARAAGVGSVRLANYAIRQENVRLLPKEFAARHELVPIDRFGNQVVIAMVCPLNYTAVNEVENITGLQARTVLCSGDAFRLALEHFYPHNGLTGNT
jgi:type IV pilus assembly protein PilB